MHNDPDLDFTNDNYVVIREGRSRSKYFFTEPTTIVTPPDKTMTMPTEDVSFELSTEQLDKLMKAASVYQLPDLSAIGGEGVVKLVVRDKKNQTSNDYAVVVGETEGNFVFNFKVENLKVLPGSYDVIVSQKLLSKFTCRQHDLTYYIALEPDSSYEE